MKIAMVGTAFPHRGGIAHFNALLYKTLESRDHEMKIFSFSRQYPSLFFPGKTQYDDSKDSIPINATPTVDSINPFTWYKTAKKIIQYNPDLIIFKYWMPFFAPAFATIAAQVKKKCPDTKVLYICDNIIPHEKQIGDNFLTKCALSTVDYFIVMSKSVGNDLKLFKPEAPVEMVYHPVYEIFETQYSKKEARKLLNLPSGPILLFFGYIRKYKGLEVLLDAMPILQNELNLKLLIAGEFYDDEQKYIKKIKSLELKNSVILKSDYIPNEKVGLYFAAADAVALPYISATQSGIVQVCYNYNKPVIATDVGGLPEVVIDKKTGFIVPSNNPNAFAKAVIRFYQEKREEEFSNNVKTEKKKYSWDNIASVIENFMSGK